MITYEKKNLFEANKYNLIIHACNAQGIWGSGIAKNFKELYPKAYEIYQKFCNNKKVVLTGKAGFHSGYENHDVGWIITSENYGPKKDRPSEILGNTALAVVDLCEKLINYRGIYQNKPPYKIYSNKFNSGLFNVPWEDTELVLNQVLKHYPDIRWIVCDPNL